ncbi:hypothetical protein [Thalassoglobus neptunius]|nr:hypothetical protein [Thalassoglobus neptunius]
MSTMRIQTFAAILTASGMLAGCTSCEKCADMGDITPQPLGTLSDPVWQQQESNAEASDFVIYEHEWNGNSVDLNLAGKDHVKQIAARIESTPYPVIIERSSMSIDPESEFRYPVNNNRELDEHRRQLIVDALTAMGMYEAENRVVVGPALTPGFTGPQAQRAYARGMSSQSGYGGNYGGAYGGGFSGGVGGF